MNLLKQWKGKDAIELYQKEFKEPVADFKKHIDYIELIEMSDGLNAYLVYYKETKKEAKVA